MSELLLIEAVIAEDEASVKKLIDTGVDINQQDEQGWTPLNWASGKGNLGLVKILIERGADVFKVGRDLRTPYAIALAAGHVDVVKFLRQAEEKVGGEKSNLPERKYCKAYYLTSLRQFSGWTESRINWRGANANGEAEAGESERRLFSDDDIVFLHQDYTVTQSMWHSENVIFNQVTPEWQMFCTEALKFKVPDDIDLILSAKSASIDGSS